MRHCYISCVVENLTHRQQPDQTESLSKCLLYKMQVHVIYAIQHLASQGSYHSMQSDVTVQQKHLTLNAEGLVCTKVPCNNMLLLHQVKHQGDDSYYSTANGHVCKAITKQQLYKSLDLRTSTQSNPSVLPLLCSCSTSRLIASWTSPHGFVDK